MARLFDSGLFSANTMSGAIGVGYKLYFYTTGTTTPKNTYPTRADAVAGTNANANPVVAAADGRWSPIWLAGGDYKVVLKDFDDVTLKTRDPADTNIEGQLSATTGAALVGAVAGDGVTPTTLQRHIVRTYLEDIGVTGGSGGGADANTAAINAYWASSGRHLYRRPGERYNIGSSLVATSNAGIVGDGENSIIYMSAAKFNNATLRSYASNAVAIRADGQSSGGYTPIDNIRFEGLTIQSEVSDGRYLRGIVVRNGTDIQVSGVEIFGFPIGIGLTLSGLRDNCIIDRPYIHDFTSDYAWGSAPQSTGIEVDNDHISGDASSQIRFLSPCIDGLTFGATLTGLYGNQTDGINLQIDSGGHVISSAVINDVGEAIDCWTDNCTISACTITNVPEAGVKFIHGASYNSVNGVTIRNVGRWGIVMSGTTAAAQSTVGNTVNGGSIENLNYQNTFTSAATTGGVVFTNNGGTTYRPSSNLVNGMTIVEGQYGFFGWLDESDVGGNSGEAMNIIAGAANVKRIQVSSSGGNVRLAGLGTYYTSLV